MILRRLFLPVLLAILTGCAGTAQKPSQNTLVKQPGHTDRYVARDTSRTIDLTQPPTDAWERIRRGFAIPNMEDELTQQWTEYYASHPGSVKRMSERAGKYLYYIIEEINRRGLPTELALLPFVESAYDPAALSRASAAGLWQFIPSTGTHFNLKQDSWRDERRDPIASTHAALNYLEYLFDMQGDWYLALASYNWGEGSVRRAMERNTSAGLPTDYLSLTMPSETRNYVPKLQAIKNIISDPDRYALTLPQVENAPYFVTISRTDDIDLDLAARLAEMPVSEFRALNPSFNRPLIRGEHAPNLLLPADRLPVFKANLKAYDGKLATWEVYTARRGETLSTIARRFNVTENTLREINGLAKGRRVATPNTLLVPGSGNVRLASLDTPAEAEKTVKSPQTRGVVAVPSKATRTANVRSHKVRQGDTLFGLARQYGTSVDALKALNNLKGSALRVGSSLRIPGTDVRS